MSRAGDVVSAQSRLIGPLRVGSALAVLVLLASQASCMLVGYEVNQASSGKHADGGGSDVLPDDGDDGPTMDGSVATTLDGSVTLVDAASHDAASDDAASDDAGASLRNDAGGKLTDSSAPFVDASATTDASSTTPPPTDASAMGTPDATTLPGCSGPAALGLCWHLGPSGLSCDETCDSGYGGFDWRTIFYTGKPSEGGSLANCQTVLLALGITTPPTATYRPDGLGLGCHVRASGTTLWLDDRQGPFDSGDSLFGVQRACACAR
jgi:hypothetical protein